MHSLFTRLVHPLARAKKPGAVPSWAALSLLLATSAALLWPQTNSLTSPHLLVPHGRVTRAVTLTVNSTADTPDANPGDGVCQTSSANGSACTLRAAIQESNASGGGTIGFNIPGAGAKTITLASALPNLANTLSINNTQSTSITISGNGAVRIFYVARGSNVKLQNLILTRGSSGDGGAIYNDNALLSLTDCTLSNNAASERGGAIFANGSADESDITLLRCTLSSNAAIFNGGALYNETTSTGSADMGLTQCVLQDNTASNAGAASNDGGNMRFTECTLSGNSATAEFSSGGAITNASLRQSAPTLRVIRSTLLGNSAGTGGGAISAGGNSSAESSVVLLSSTFSGNITRSTREGSGGAIYNIASESNANVQINDCTFARNNGVQGASIANFGANASTAKGTIVTQNSIFLRGTGTTNFFNRSGRDASQPSDVNSAVANINTFGYNLCDDSNNFLVQPTDRQNRDPQLGALASNGGPTQTHALLTGSPAIDAGFTDASTDQRGAPRPQGSADDIGAFESGNAAIPTATPVVTATSGPTSTPISTNTPRPTATPVATSTPRPTTTPIGTATPAGTATPRPTITPVGTATPRPTNTPTGTATPRPTNTPTGTATPRPTNTPTGTATPRPTSTATPRPTSTPRPTATSTPRPTVTPAPTSTPRPTPTSLPTATPQPSLAINDVSVSEGNSGTKNATFTVTLSGNLNGPVSVRYATSNGTATSGSDYTATSGTLTFGGVATAARARKPRALSQTISVSVSGDTTRESNETFFVNLSNASGASISRSSGTGTILNDDTAADLSVTQSASASSVPTGSLVTFTLTVRNNGPDASSGVTLTDVLPSNATFVSSTPPPSSRTDNTLVFALGSLANGATQTISVQVRAPGNAGTLQNGATVAGSGAPDPSAPNNGSSASVVVTTGAPAYSFALGKLINVGPYSPSLYRPGAHLVQDVTITNTGIVPSGSSLSLLLTGLPSSVNLVNTGGTTNGTPFVALPTALAVGQSVTIRLEFRLTRSDKPTFSPQIADSSQAS